MISCNGAHASDKDCKMCGMLGLGSNNKSYSDNVPVKVSNNRGVVGRQIG